jgi:hypothetical protein
MSRQKLPQNPSGKKDRRKEYITFANYVASVVSLKTLRGKAQWEELTKEKNYNNLIISESSLQD